MLRRTYDLSDHADFLDMQLCDAFQAHQTLIGRMNKQTATKLLVRTIEEASHIDPKTFFVVIIDGLDQTDQDQLEETVTVFCTIF
ncbi:hypothetical protein C0991_007132 [Blastosporella zonata]|nr:hypothetical protein C0991_007132 [Blastosporella zonata]